MSHSSTLSCLSFGLVFCFASYSLAADADEKPLVEIQLSRNLRVPTISVSTQAGDALFAIDTGCSGLVIDHSLARLLVDNPQLVPAAADSFPLEVKLRAGGFQSTVDHACIQDLAPFRTNRPLPVLGIIGMNSLRPFRLRCDFDGEVFSIFEKSVVDKRESTQIFLAERGRPTIIAAIGTRSFPVLIDLGSEYGFEVPKGVFAGLDGPRVQSITQSFTSSGVGQQGGYKQCSLRIGELQFRDLLVAESDGEYGVAGLEFLCRLNFDLDFTNKRMFYQKSKRFEARDNSTRFGLSLDSYSGTEVPHGFSVVLVSADSVAQKQGIKPGDIVVSATSNFYGTPSADGLYTMLGLPQVDQVTVDVLREGKKLQFKFE